MVVGVDDSAASRAALRWAELKVTRDGGELVIVHVHEPPAVAPYARVRGRSGGVPDIAALVVVGNPVRELIRLAEDAELLVLGSNANTHRDERLGAVLMACLLHAPCPVVVVSPQPADDPAQRSLSALPAASLR
ncbi:universal stress protein [Nonomuraea soli]